MAPTPTETPVTPEITPQQQAREEVQQKYDRLYGQQTPVVETPVVVPSTPTPDPQTSLMDVVRALKDEIVEMKASLLRPTSNQPTPAEPEPAVKLTPWFEHLRAGDFEGAEQDLTNRVKDSVTVEAARRAVSEAVETIRVQSEIDKYITRLRTENPDLVAVERYLQAPVAQRVESAKAAKKIANGSDFIREYCAAVDAEVAEWRKIGLQQRAAGAEQARVGSQRVLSATPLSPQSVTSTQEAGATTPPPVETVEDYFSRRRQKEALGKGMG